MRTVGVVVCGLGGVGRALLGLLAEKKQDIRDSREIDFVLTAAVDIGGAAMSNNREGLPPGALKAHLERKSPVEEFADCGRPGLSGQEAIRQAEAQVLVETTPTNLEDGEPGTTHIRTALEQKMEVVSANKGPLVLYFRELHELARANGCGIHISAATAAALPTIDVGRVCLAGTRILSVEGILNGTTNYVLTRMRTEGCTYEVALKGAQELGIAETNPSFDVEGKDTANKMILISNRIFGTDYGPDDIAVKGITEVTPGDIAAAAADGKVIKLIGSAVREGDRIALRVAPVALAGDHPLALVNGSEKAISYMTDTMDRVTVSGGKSSPVGAAAAVLKDMINAFS